MGLSVAKLGWLNFKRRKTGTILIIIGLLISIVYNKIKSKKISAKSVGGIVGVLGAMFLLILNAIFVKAIRGARFRILPIESWIIKDIIILIFAFILGSLIGYFYGKYKRREVLN